MVGDVQQVIATALGAETVTTTVEGRERYAVSLRYPRDIRSDPQAIARETLLPLANGSSIPLAQVANIRVTQGPASIRTENAQLAAYIYIDVRERDLGGYVEDARKAVSEKVVFPPATMLSGAVSTSITSAPSSGLRRKLNSCQTQNCRSFESLRRTNLSPWSVTVSMTLQPWRPLQWAWQWEGALMLRWKPLTQHCSTIVLRLQNSSSCRGQRLPTFDKTSPSPTDAG
jgi:AcrB/AcrD/AcrF family